MSYSKVVMIIAVLLWKVVIDPAQTKSPEVDQDVNQLVKDIAPDSSGSGASPTN